ncbi:MAG: glutamate-1-semialdehyde-2,1-aminomutase [Nitrospirae bacterium RBG_16_43_11]|nr:MAG: glutamate-1-semialdehyde-2,1-aminomutase [Nitrospirae bacterium RBG_16_43_11]
MKHDKSLELFEAALSLMPGGVNSPVRAFKAVGGHPIFIDRASGCLMYDADGNEYIDYVLSWGPMIAGHTHPAVTEALKEAVSRGTSFGAPTALEIELTRMVRDAFPSMELVRLVNSGTEATMSAIRLARAHTGRDKILKFEGCYHGHADSLLVKAGSGVATLGVPDSPGVPADFAKNTLTAPFNNFEAVKMIMENNGSDIACIIVEPVPGNMGVVPSADGFLRMLREITTQYGTLLIFDEVMSGFRVAYGGAQELYGITPDLTCLGKIIGGGLPVGAYGGRKEIMEKIAPSGPVYQAGTLSGNPLAMTAGIETLKILSQPGTYERLNRLSEQLSQGFSDAAKSAGATVYNTGVGSMVCTFFTEGPVTDYESAKKSDTVAFGKFFLAMLEEGIYLAPSQFEAIFLSIAHKEEHVEKTIRAANKAFRKAGR